MNSITKPMTILEDGQVPVQAKLAAAWTSFMFLYIYVDHLGLYKPGVVDGILNGLIWKFDVSSTLLTIIETLQENRRVEARGCIEARRRDGNHAANGRRERLHHCRIWHSTAVKIL